LKKKIYPCVIGLGYVGLPVFLRLKKKFKTIGFDINKNRINSLSKKIDNNKEFNSRDLNLDNKSEFVNSLKKIRNCNFFIITVPTPLKKKNMPDLSYLFNATNMVAKYLKKGDIIIYESTVYPGTTELLVKSILEKKTSLIENSDFFVGYSPERINPGDSKHTIKNIVKILAIKNQTTNIKNKIVSVYSSISKKLYITNSIKEAETAKVLENIQRDLNIALMNDIFMFSKKMGYSFSNIIKIAATKWNFLKFDPGLVGGHCLPVDPHYLHYIAKKNRINLKTILAGRAVNSNMEKFIISEIKQKINKFKIAKNKIKILIVGVTYKKNVCDIRNSLPLKIFINLKSQFKNTFAYDYIYNSQNNKQFNIINKIDLKKKYDLTVFLVNHDNNKKIYSHLIKSKSAVYDPFNFYLN